jgi:glycosyltransferase involved in cell wall biosynthesis
MLKISLITVTYNSAATLDETIRSVISQDYPALEYIIKDGVSSDATLHIAGSHGEKVTKVVSEPDKGLYDALNCGLKLAGGDIVGFLHSDDMFVHNQVLSRVAAVFEKENCEAVYADLYYVDRENAEKVTRKWKSGKYREGLFLEGWMPPHPTFFVRRDVYERYGNFNTEFRTSADYELMLRFIHKHKIKVAYLEDYIVKMRTGGQSNVSVSNRILANKEDRKAWRVNDLKPKFYTLTLKPVRKIFQYL